MSSYSLEFWINFWGCLIMANVVSSTGLSTLWLCLAGVNLALNLVAKFKEVGME